MRREKKASIAILLLAISMLTAQISSNATAESPTTKGPREDDMSITFYATQEAAYTALVMGEIDFMLSELTSSQADNAFTNPNIVTAHVADSGFYEFDLNNNYTIADYPGIRSPMNYTEMRQACAFLSDKDYYVGTLLGGKAARIDQMIAAPYYGWANASMSYPFYPYEYSPAAAKAVLDTTFPPGATANPYHDSLDPLSSPTLRTYPVGHEKAGTDLDPLKFKVRVDSTALLNSGRGVVDWLRKMGVPIDSEEGTSSALYSIVMDDFNYHFYTGSWTVGRFPPMTLYGLYHSSNAFPGGSNYVTGVRPGVPTHPKLDAYLYAGNYATTYSQAVTACKKAAGYMTEICVNVPLWSVASYWAWSKNVFGVTNMLGYGLENPYTFMKASKEDGSPLRCGVVGAPNSMNIIYNSWSSEAITLSKMNLYGGLDIQPYSLADQPGFVQEWTVSTWDDGGTAKTKLTRTFRSDGYFAKPVSGDLGANVNASHFFFSTWLMNQLGDSPWTSEFADVHHITIESSHTTSIYFDTLSYWHTYVAAGPFLPMDTWGAQPELVTKIHGETVVAPATPGPITLSNLPCWFEEVTFDGTPLTFGTDYNIVLGELYIYAALGTGTLSVDYWAPNDPHGYTPSNIAWQTIFEGAGMYYCTAYTPGVSATFKRNPFYYMETPPYAEIDFVRKPNGAFRVDIFDLSLFDNALYSTGTGIPTSSWFPGADIAPPGGYVDPLYDQLTFYWGWGEESRINSWDQEWDVPPAPLYRTKATPTMSTTIKVTPELIDLGPEPAYVVGTEFDVAVVVENVTNFAGFDIKLDWDEEYLEHVAHTVTMPVEDFPDPIPPSQYAGVLHSPIFVTLDEVNYTTGTYWLGGATLSGNGFNGNGTLFAMTLRVKKQLDTPIETSLELISTVLADLETNPIEHTTVDGLVIIPPTPPPPYPVTFVDPPTTTVYQGSSFSIKVSMNHADRIYGYLFKLYFDRSLLSVQDVTEGPLLQNAASTLFTVVLSNEYNATHGLVWCLCLALPSGGGSPANGNGTMATINFKASENVGVSPLNLEVELARVEGYARPVPHDKADGSVFVTYKGDTDKDGDVDLFDLVRMAGVYGVEYPDPRYDPDCDLDGDLDIDIFDLVSLARNYGKKVPLPPFFV